jgi:hypothetical protein
MINKTIENLLPTSGNWKLETGNRKQEIGNRKQETGNHLATELT